MPSEPDRDELHRFRVVHPDPWRDRALHRPRYRGLLHLWCFYLSVPIALVVIVAAGNARSSIAAAAFVLSVTVMFGISATFHRRDYADEAWYLMRRVDRTAIFLLIAGSYTAIGALGLDGGGQGVFLVLGGWFGAAIGIALLWSPWQAPRGTITALYIALGWMSVLAITWMWSEIGPAGTILMVLGGVLYTVGALIVGFQYPDPWPDSFGYHEIWHVLTVAAVACHYWAIVFTMLYS